ncbi:hypothetical protein RU50_005483 [Salmonella enterica subsp. enterica]|nr:hypothetical protein [Salmonella enterica subsp. enterica]
MFIVRVKITLVRLSTIPELILRQLIITVSVLLLLSQCRLTQTQRFTILHRIINGIKSRQ